MKLAFDIGSCGYLVRDLQRGAGLAQVDGAFGMATGRAVMDVQRVHGLEQTGKADEATFAALGLVWPDEFERCLNLTSCLEGTSFGDCNATDIDGAGLTFGVAGFTTASGEVQTILRHLRLRNPQAFQVLSESTHAKLQQLVSSRTTDDGAWKQLFYGSDCRVRPEWIVAFRTWGGVAEMQSAQKDLARELFWQPALRAVHRLRLESNRARALLFDIAVQNGGWNVRHQRVFDSLVLQKRPCDEQATLDLIAQAVATCAASKWRTDVLARKLMLARGSGFVHGRQYDLHSYAIE